MVMHLLKVAFGKGGKGLFVVAAGLFHFLKIFCCFSKNKGIVSFQAPLQAV